MHFDHGLASSGMTGNDFPVCPVLSVVNSFFSP